MKASAKLVLDEACGAMRLRDRVAIVTGGSKGIGAAISRRFAQEGAAVAIVSRSIEAGAAVVDAIRDAGGHAAAFEADCSCIADIREVVRSIVEVFGGLDIVVSNAGVHRGVPIEETTEKIWDEVLDLNLKGPFFLAQAAAPHLRRRGRGKMIFISSVAGVRAFADRPAYCAAKAGLVNLAKALAVDLARCGINVNVIAPGSVATPATAHLLEPEGQAYVQSKRDRTPTGRAFLTAEEVAAAAVFLASDDASAVHGDVMMVDDGWCTW